jgi:hypothetical protein
VPEAQSEGFKLATYRSWFCPSDLDKGEGFAYNVHSAQQIKALATFRMGAHDLHIETLRRAANRRPRDQRLCRCCDAGAREDEMHILECAAYADIRTQFHDLFDEHTMRNPLPSDVCMTNIMNPSGAGWPRLANFLIRVMAKRRRIMRALG